MSQETGSTEFIQVLEPDKKVLAVARDICRQEDQEDAFYLLDLGDIVRKHEEWKRRLPRVKPFYAVKCHDNVTMIRTLAALGTGFDCASKVEIEKVMDVGVPASSIIFANPAKQKSHIRRAATLGVHVMTFDNVFELRKIHAINPEAKLVLRFRCDAKGAIHVLGEKFGCEPLREAPQLLRDAHEIGADVVGVSFHSGRCCEEPAVFRRALNFARGIFDAAQRMGFPMTLLDIGGGFSGEEGSSIVEIAEVINLALTDLFPGPDVEVIAEPGTFYASSAFTLFTQIHSKREVEEESGKHVMYYINDGVFGSFHVLLFDLPVPDPKPLNPRGDSTYSSSVWGPTCTSCDRVNKSLLLPKLEVDDWLVYSSMGAYTLALATPFNGFPIPRVHVVIDPSSWWTLRDTAAMMPQRFVFDYNPAVFLHGLVDDDSEDSVQTQSVTRR